LRSALRAPRSTDPPALHVAGTALPGALYGGAHVPSVADLDQFRSRLGIPDGPAAQQQHTALDQIVAQHRSETGSLLQFVQQTQATAYATSARLEGITRAGNSGAHYPQFYGLARRLKTIAQLIKAGLHTSIYYTQLGGFDTHANQLGTHAGLLREVGDSLRAFQDDLKQAGQAERVVTLVFSEFGRRLRENASGGTDHGTAAPVFLIGARVRPGLHGPYPDLQHLVDGDPRHGVDFRQIYATVLDRWLDCPSEGILGGRFAHVAML
jgi:uncharacterized protein (DUF1501 family)